MVKAIRPNFSDNRPKTGKRRHGVGKRGPQGFVELGGRESVSPAARLDQGAQFRIGGNVRVALALCG
jgi:hypothetical protein